MTHSKLVGWTIETRTFFSSPLWLFRGHHIIGSKKISCFTRVRFLLLTFIDIVWSLWVVVVPFVWGIILCTPPLVIDLNPVRQLTGLTKSPKQGFILFIVKDDSDDVRYSLQIIWSQPSYFRSIWSQADKNSLCVDGIVQKSVSFYRSVLDEMKHNLITVPSLRSQYYGRADGYVIGYPAVQKTITVYDPRLRYCSSVADLWK